MGYDGAEFVTAKLPGLATRIGLLDPATRWITPLRLPVNARVCEFSRDGTTLLLLTHPQGSAIHPRVTTYDLKTRAYRSFGDQATEAVWID